MVGQIPRLAVIGGGITGLVAAWEARRRAESLGVPLEVVLFERSERVGGLIHTLRVEDALVDAGPDSFLAAKRGGIWLCRELGLTDRLVSPLTRRFQIYLDGRLYDVPYELVSLVPSKPEALFRASFLSPLGRFRAAMEMFVPRWLHRSDESMARFLRLRFGAEFQQRFAEPLMGGVHAGDPDLMSMPAVYPLYWSMVQNNGSMTRALMRARLSKRGSSHAGSPFRSLKGGMAELTEALASRLHDCIVCGISVESLHWEGRGLCVRCSDGRREHFDHVLLTTPAYETARILAPLGQGLGTDLLAIPYASSAVVTLRYATGALDQPDVSGYLASHRGGEMLSGCTFSSIKWPDRLRSGILLRAFIGRYGCDEAVNVLTDEELVQVVHQQMIALFNARVGPERVWVHRWRLAFPQYMVGHLARVDQITRRIVESGIPISLAGSAYTGTGIPDCTLQACRAVDSCLRRLYPQLQWPVHTLLEQTGRLSGLAESQRVKLSK